MLKKSTVALALAAAFVTTAAQHSTAADPVSAARTQEEIQAPREESIQAPRGDGDVQAPRDSGDVQAPREENIQAPRG